MSTISYMKSGIEKEVLLSICIPTYNRAEYLFECIKSVLENIDSKNQSNIEILVLDNASNDKTEVMMNEIANKYPFITYIRRCVNAGLDRNVCESPRLAKGRYVWLLGDDDSILPNKVNYVLDLISQNKADFYLINKQCSNIDLSKINIAKEFQCQENKTYSSLIDLIKEFGLLTTIGFISICLFKKSTFTKIDFEKYLNTHICHVGVILEGFYNKKAMLIADVCVNNRQENDSDETKEKWNALSSVNLYKLINTLAENESKTEVILSTINESKNYYNPSDLCEYSLLNLKQLFEKRIVTIDEFFTCLIYFEKEEIYKKLIFLKTIPIEMFDKIIRNLTDKQLDIMKKHITETLITYPEELLLYRYFLKIDKFVDVQDTEYKAEKLDGIIDTDFFVYSRAVILNENKVDLVKCLSKRLNFINSFNNIIIFGAGVTGKAYAEVLLSKGIKIEQFIDNYPPDTKRFLGLKVSYPKEIPNIIDKKILIATIGREDIFMQQLLELGANINNIVFIHDLYREI